MIRQFFFFAKITQEVDSTRKIERGYILTNFGDWKSCRQQVTDGSRRWQTSVHGTGNRKFKLAKDEEEEEIQNF